MPLMLGGPGAGGESSSQAPSHHRDHHRDHHHDHHQDGTHSAEFSHHRLALRRASRIFTEASSSLLLRKKATARQRLWQFLNSSLTEDGSPRQKWAKRFEYFCALLILVNVLADVLDSVPTFPFTEDNSPTFRVLERFSCVLFTVEYGLRAWSCPEAEEFQMIGSELMRRVRFLTTVMPLIDLVVVAVFYLDIFMSSNAARGFQSLRVIRTLRLVALLKMERQMQSFQSVFYVFSKRRHDLFATLFLAMVLLVIASTAMYYVETEAQPEQFSSIPATMWWSVTAMTTVGYGDIFPVTVPGKVLGSCVAFLGVGLFALPSGIISSGFVEVLEEARQADTDELAEILDEDKASIDKLHDEVVLLRKQLETMSDRLSHAEDSVHGVREDQRRTLELLEQLVVQTAPLKEAPPPRAPAPPRPLSQVTVGADSEAAPSIFCNNLAKSPSC